MPELPEVHTITQDLKKHAAGLIISKVIIAKNYSVFPDNHTFVNQIGGQQIKDAFRIAKNIVLETEAGNLILFHLAMTGKLLLRPQSFTSDKHTRVTFTLTQNANLAYQELRFTDVRMFGKVRLSHTDFLAKIRQNFGPDPLDPGLTASEFHKIVQSKKTTIKNLLLDQKKISGIGNVYATDALWMTGIHPATHTSKIGLTKATELLDNLRTILQEGIDNRGISMSDYVDLFGNKGRQQEHFRIYRQIHCPTCAGNIEFTKLNGRSTYFCATCQLTDHRDRLL